MAKPAYFQAPANPIASATSADLCAILRCSQQTLRRMEADGRIPPATRIGRRKLWPAEAVAKLLGTAQKGGAQC